VIEFAGASRESAGRIDDEGWLAAARRVESPNFDVRPSREPISLIVVHAISLPPDEFGSDDIVRLFTNALDARAHAYFAAISTLRVSAHFLIRRDGELVQLVSCEQRAWHAGLSCWQGRECCNDFSIGIELEGCDEMAFEPAQYLRLAGLIESTCARYPIDAVVGHSDIAPGRKSDPGPCFDWQKLETLIRQPGCAH